MNTDWIKDLEVGDKVYIKQREFETAQLDLTTVKKITPKGHIRTNDNSLFRDGERRVDSWTHWYLVQWTQELKDKLKAEAHYKHMCYSINAIDARTLTPEKVQKIYDIIKEK